MLTEALGNVEIQPLQAAEEAVLGNLFELYLHDMAEWFGFDLGADGRYGYKLTSSKAAYLIRVDGALAGFALTHSAAPWLTSPAPWTSTSFSSCGASDGTGSAPRPRAGSGTAIPPAGWYGYTKRICRRCHSGAARLPPTRIRRSPRNGASSRTSRGVSFPSIVHDGSHNPNQG